MPEPPSEPPPILSYATPEPQVPVYLVVMLYLWAVFDVLVGAFLSFAELFRFIVGTFPFFLGLGLGLFIWGVMTFGLANRMLRNQIAALHRAASIVIAAEIFAWAWAGMIFVGGVIAMFTRLALFSAPFFVVLAAAVSVTRMLLRRAVKRMPTWES